MRMTSRIVMIMFRTITHTLIKHNLETVQSRRKLCTLGLSFARSPILLSMSEVTLLPSNTVECAWCKDSKPVNQTTWFMPEPGERSVRLCSFCYEEARKQVRLLRFVRNRGEFPVEAAS